MKSKIFFALLILILQAPVIKAQENISIRKKDFKKEKLGFREAWKHIRTGDKLYEMKGVWYGTAYDEYLKAVAYNSSNPELNYKTGVSALLSDKKDEAAAFLLKAIEADSEVAGDAMMLTARALQYAGKYQEALDMYTAVLNEKGKKKKNLTAAIGNYINECRSALEISKDTIRLDIVNAGSVINSNSDEYSELLSPDGKTIWFASRRQLNKSSTQYDDGKYDENIYFSSSSSGSWSIPSTPGKSVTTELCEAPLYITPAADELYFYSGSDNGGDVKVVEYKKGKWRSPSAIRYRINTGGAETAFTFSPSGNEIWFVTDKGKKSRGGRDIYYITKAGEKKWTRPVNAGDSINTTNDEEAVRFSDRGDTLWFSSKGHNTLGGFDIFYSIRKADGVWGKAVNAGFPLNTPFDEMYYQPVKGDDSTFYFVSDRSGGMGGLDIYRGKYLPPVPVAVVIEPPKPDTVVVMDTVVVVKEITPEPLPAEPVAIPVVEPVPEAPKEIIIYLIGKITDSESGEAVLAKIDLIDLSNDQIVTTTASSDVDGSYRIRLPERKPYMVDLRATGFLSDMKRVNIASTDTMEVYNLNVGLIKVKVGKKVVLNNILFETGKSIINPGSYPELNRLTGILQDSPTMRVEISGHTDNTGSLQINTTLSEARAKAVVEYLVKKGIERTRLEYKGYGPQQPIADNSTPAGRTQNRRVEFKILEF